MPALSVGAIADGKSVSLGERAFPITGHAASNMNAIGQWAFIFSVPASDSP
jgi:hypothetical protein